MGVSIKNDEVEALVVNLELRNGFIREVFGRYITDDVVNTLRLWAAKPTNDFDLSFFNSGDYVAAVETKNQDENIPTFGRLEPLGPKALPPRHRIRYRTNN